MSTVNKELLEALNRIANPIKYFQQEAEEQGATIDGQYAISLSNDPNYLKGIANEAISKAEQHLSAGQEGELTAEQFLRQRYKLVDFYNLTLNGHSWLEIMEEYRNQPSRISQAPVSSDWKEHFKPPFKYADDSAVYVLDANGDIVVEIRGWGMLTNKMSEKEAIDVQEQIAKHIAAILNGEPHISSRPSVPTLTDEEIEKMVNKKLRIGKDTWKKAIDHYQMFLSGALWLNDYYKAAYSQLQGAKDNSDSITSK